MEATSLCATRPPPPPESAEAAGGGKRLKSKSMDSLEESDWDSKPYPWDIKPYDDLVESDMSMLDDDPTPLAFSHKGFRYKNKARIQQEKANADYKERCDQLEDYPWDAIEPPDNIGLFGFVTPYPIDDDERPFFTRLCDLALKKYNADNQGANFVFVDLVKSTSACLRGRIFYITFKAKDASNNTAAARIFQAKVLGKMIPKDAEPVVASCSMKPT